MDQTTLILLVFFVYLIVGSSVSMVSIVERSRDEQQADYRFSATKAFLQHTATMAAALLWPFFASSLAQAFGHSNTQSFWIMVITALVAWIISGMAMDKPVIGRSGLLGGVLTLLLAYLFLGSGVDTATKIIVPIVATLLVFGGTFMKPMSKSAAVEEAK